MDQWDLWDVRDLRELWDLWGLWNLCDRPIGLGPRSHHLHVARTLHAWHARCNALEHGAGAKANGETEKSGLIGVGACAQVVMLQGAVKETPVEATLVRGVPFSIPRTWLRKMALPPDHAIFFVQRFPFELVAPSFSSSCPRLRLLVFLPPRFLLQAALMGPLENTSIHEHPVRCTCTNRSWANRGARPSTTIHQHLVRCTCRNRLIGL